MGTSEQARESVEAGVTNVAGGKAGAASAAGPALGQSVDGGTKEEREYRSRVLVWIGIVVALGFPSLPVAKWVNEFAGIGNLVGYELIWWAVVGFLLAYVAVVERRPLSSLGFRALTKVDLVVAIAAALVMVAGLATIYYLVFPWLGISENSQIGVLLATPLWWRIISVIRAAVSEEVLFRGYAIERLEGLTGSRGVAATVSCVVFAAAHVGPWGWGHLLIAGFGGVMLTALYLWRRNLWVNIIAHAVVDGVAVLSG